MDNGIAAVEHEKVLIWRVVVVLSVIAAIPWLVLALLMLYYSVRFGLPGADWAQVTGLYLVGVPVPSVVLVVGLYNKAVWADWLSLVFDASIAPLIGGIAYRVASWDSGVEPLTCGLIAATVGAVLRGSICARKRIGWWIVPPYLAVAGFLAYRGFLLADKLPS